MSRILEINNVATPILVGWSVVDRINTRSTLSFSAVKTINIQIGATIDFYDNDIDNPITIFRGLISHINLYQEGDTIFCEVEAVDNTAIADRRIVAFAVENLTAKEIIEDYIFPILQEEGVTLGDISTGVFITKGVFSYLTCSKAMDYLVNLSPSYSWNIDNDMRLNYFTKGDYSAPFNIDSSTYHFNFKPTQIMEQYRNRQYIRGGKGYTSLQIDQYPTSQPDGTSRDFVFRYKIAKKPTKLEYFATGNWYEIAQSDIGILNLDTGKKWYYSYDNNIITQDQSELVLTTSNKIRMSYYGLRNIFIITDNLEEISNRQVIENYGTGIYENLTVEKSLVTTEQAQQFGNGLLEKYAEVKDKIEFKTISNGLRSGMLIYVNMPLFYIDANFLIESVTTRAINSNTYEYSIKALDGASVGGWEEYFKTIIKSVNSFEISADEVLYNVKLLNEMVNFSSYLYGYNRTLVFPSETLEPSNTLNIGQMTILEFISERVDGDIITTPTP